MFLLVLNDGETFTDLRGCKILRIDGKPKYEDDIDLVVKDIHKGKKFIPEGVDSVRVVAEFA